MTRLFCIAFLLFSGSLSPCEAAEKPNIVFFYIDDLGWADVGFMGSEFYETPNIDQLAAESMVFTDAYANAPNCAPSRACLMSGKYPPRHGIYTVGDPRRGNHKHRKLEPIENETVLAEEFITFAEALKTNGYTTATMGKWHLGKDPTTQGFDINIAGREWGSPSGGGYHSPYQYPNLSQKKAGEYLTNRLTDEACRFIESSKEKPFFLYLTHYAVHTPIQAEEKLIKKYDQKKPGKHQKNSKYAAMVESVDNSVGEVMKKLNELSLTKNTIVIFYSDNGGHEGATSNHPLRGAKGMLYEGGIREPFLCRWDGVTKPGSRCDEPIIGIDLYPTFLEMTGTAKPNDYELDGRSIVPLLKDPQSSLNREAIFWHFPCYLQGKGDPQRGPFRTTPAGAIRKGDWKLIEWFETGHRELYNLREDLGETRNLMESRPEIANDLYQSLLAWREEVHAPIPRTPNPKYRPSRN
ncbi:sulfatase [Thalassoglobus sp.]|uniref:sulfatase n=1 Tax=Thalassoglobus sp. TaxID=2795869 RepID=UPI003AA95168